MRPTTLILLCLAFLSGCASSHTFVLDPAMGERTHTVVSVTKMKSWMDVPNEVSESFEKKITGKLAPEAKVADDRTPAELVIQYRFVLFDKGSTAARLGSGVAGVIGSPFYGIGDGTLGVDVTFSNPQGNLLARIVVDGPVTGVFGTTDSGLNKASIAIVDYAKMFLIPAPLKPGEKAARETSEPARRESN